jgi:hypothetical protein
VSACPRSHQGAGSSVGYPCLSRKSFPLPSNHSALGRDEEVVHRRRAPAVCDCQSRAKMPSEKVWVLQHGEARMWDPDQRHAQDPLRGKSKTAADTLRDHDGIPQGEQKMLSEDSSEVRDRLSADQGTLPSVSGEPSHCRRRERRVIGAHSAIECRE